MAWQNRTIMLIGEQNQTKLNNAKVIVFGVGGVGGHVIEALARAGIQNLTIVDKDVVDKTNINRQIIALNSTIGKLKTEVMKQRILDINPNAKVNAISIFVSNDNVKDFNLRNYDYVVDAIDNITAKIELAKECDVQNVKIISCMGTGNKLCPELFEITDINKTSVCPLARVMRKKLKEIGIKKLTVLYSKEEPIQTKLRLPASISFTPSIAGLRIAEFVIKELLKKDENE